MAKYDVTTVEKKYKVSLPPRAKKLIDGELATHSGRKLAKPIDGNLSQYDTILFGKASLFDTNLFDRKLHPTKVPLAALADASGSWRMELFVLECAGKEAGSIYFGRPIASAGEKPPALKRVADNVDGLLKLLAKR